jgi:hypothetical protein
MQRHTGKARLLEIEHARPDNNIYERCGGRHLWTATDTAPQQASPLARRKVIRLNMRRFYAMAS